jgi:two-component system phosphate regulon sensor histidine kinase PhoR
MIAHDMKNPLVVAGGFLKRLAAEKAGPTTEKQNSYIELILGEITKVQNLISALSEFSRHETGAYTPDRVSYDLEKALHQWIELAQTEAENQNIQVHLVFPEKGLPVVNADPSIIERVVANLLNNAIKYTPPGGTVTVTAFEREDDLLVEVSDTGIGIPAEDLPYIFDAFHRVRQGPERKRTEGTGLGLYICKKIVQAHGGSITAESSPGRGASFRFSLPK